MEKHVIAIHRTAELVGSCIIILERYLFNTGRAYPNEMQFGNKCTNMFNHQDTFMESSNTDKRSTVIQVDIGFVKTLVDEIPRE